eukprot:CAMPEP_0194204344 /NCGR_PEP_ID=MMETSP0156-20130528/3897_1 /TAXON_ID=33649 /ORGANISM="Thalassionema nitzschioides, Strain L26-B" /LENGTH=497 /DNA_ID=CAMNT_0038930337 /DNA_START=122 /DNA_END=1618 /DNA_ORIENTATION=+
MLEDERRSSFLQETTEALAEDDVETKSDASSSSFQSAVGDDEEDNKAAPELASEEESEQEREDDDDTATTPNNTAEAEAVGVNISEASLNPTRNFQRRGVAAISNSSEGSSTLNATLYDSEGQTIDSTLGASSFSLTMSEAMRSEESTADISERSRGVMDMLRSPDTSQRSKTDQSTSESVKLRHALEASALQLEDLVDSAMLESGGVMGRELEVGFHESGDASESEQDPEMVVGFASARLTQGRGSKVIKHHAESDSDEDIPSEEDDDEDGSSVSSSSTDDAVSYEVKSVGSEVSYEVKPDTGTAKKADDGTLLVGFEKRNSRKVTKGGLSQHFSSSLHQSGLLDIIEEQDEEEGLFDLVDKELMEDQRRKNSSVLRASNDSNSSSRSIGSGDGMKKPASFRSYEHRTPHNFNTNESTSNLPQNQYMKSTQRKLVIMFGMLLVILASLAFIAVFLAEVVRQEGSSSLMVTNGMFEHSSDSGNLEDGMYQFDNSGGV